MATSAAAFNVAGRLSSRAELNNVLGPFAVHEDFETYEIAPYTFEGFSSPLNANTIARGQGPGLVKQGIQFANQNELQWYGTTVFGGNSKRLSYSSGSQWDVLFTPPVTAFGVDLLSLETLSGITSISIINSADQVVEQFHSGNINSPRDPTFVGYAYPAGIRRITLGTYVGGPVFDNFTFGRVPEPSSFTAASAALLALLTRRRQSTVD
jgi:hypothetical protein